MSTPTPVFSIPMYFTEHLLSTLEDNDLVVEDYKPAYNGESVGLDLYNTGHTVILPPISEATVFNGRPTHKILIPTGLKVALPLGYAAIIKERGSIVKGSLVQRAGVVDPGYTNEIFVNMINTSSAPVKIEASAKLPVQLVIVQTFTHALKVVSEAEYHEITTTSKRQLGHVGSSD